MGEDKKDLVAEDEKPEAAAVGKEEELVDVSASEETIQSGTAEGLELTENIEAGELDMAPVSRAEEWLRLNEGNLKYLDAAKTQRLQKLLLKPELLDANSLNEVQKILAELEKEAEKKFNEQFDEVKKGLVQLREEMFKIPNYDNLPDELQEVALNTFTNCEIRLSNTRLVDELIEIYDNFKNIVYPDLAQKIYALENPNVLPVNLIEVLDSMPRLSFNTEEELDSALAQLREAAMKRLNKSKSKQ